MSETEKNRDEPQPDRAEKDPSSADVDDPDLAARLGEPTDPLAIYLEEASHYRPVATGDVFQDVAVPGATEEQAEHGLTLIVAHPSAMRRGAELEPRARGACVGPVKGLSRTKWTKGHAGVFPLPRLKEVVGQNGFEIEDCPWGALLDLAAPVDTDELDVRRRIACLSPEGICLLLQKIVYADTRYAVKEVHIARAFAPKLEELEMLQTWNEELVAPQVEHGAELAKALREGAREFDDVVNQTTAVRPTSIRALLESGRHSGRAQQLLAAEIRGRRNAAG